MGQVVVLGLIAGGIYALFALGIVMVYRGSGVLNFAQGEIGTAALFLAAVLVNRDVAPLWLAVLAALVFATALGAGFEFLIVRRMLSSDPVSTAVATVGLTLTIISAEFLVFGETGERVDNPFPGGGFGLFGVQVYPHHVIALVVAVALGLGLQRLLRSTDFGLGVLAAAQDPDAVRLVGVPLSRVSLVVWGLGGALSGLAALLGGPTVGLVSPSFSSEFFVFGLAAAVIGGLSSLPGAVMGGLALGLLEVAEQRYLSLDIPGERYLLLLAVVLMALLGRALWPDLSKRLAAAPATVEVTA